MYLLQSSSNPEIYFGYIIGGIVWIVIMYFVVKSAVNAANRKSEKYLRLLVNLYIEELKGKGMDEERINNLIKTT